MNVNFNDLPWHDANLLTIFIDRKVPGEQDIIKLLITWPDFDHSSIIEFSDCYAFTANMNFGVLASESILEAECFCESEELNTIRKKWSKANVNLNNLKCFKIITNTTNSVISIFALDFNLINNADII